MYDPTYSFGTPAKSAKDLYNVRVAKGLERPLYGDEDLREGGVGTAFLQGLKDGIIPEWMQDLGSYLWGVFSGSNSSLESMMDRMKREGRSDTEIIQALANKVKTSKPRYQYRGAAKVVNYLTKYGLQLVKNIGMNMLLNNAISALGARALKTYTTLPPDVNLNEAIFTLGNGKYISGNDLVSGTPVGNKWALNFANLLLPPQYSAALRLGLHPDNVQYFGSHKNPTAAIEALGNSLLDPKAIQGLNLANGTQPIINFSNKDRVWEALADKADSGLSIVRGLFNRGNATNSTNTTTPGGRLRRHRKRKTSCKKRSKCHRK